MDKIRELIYSLKTKPKIAWMPRFQWIYKIFHKLHQVEGVQTLPVIFTPYCHQDKKSKYSSAPLLSS